MEVLDGANGSTVQGQAGKLAVQGRSTKHRAGSVGGDKGLRRQRRADRLGSAGRRLLNGLPGLYWTNKKSKNSLLDRYRTGRVFRNG